ncbi:hypothetical protein HHL23_08055 [Chryseobacterium sp. RP-3-3]|uniref:Uncharacterized protein n=1 Tax=Chryseobacterium antibioticum TaxID=2728847 RepID=A0A7Y0FR09_9FLAO|nr:hypothetical protein [Chryseobacterium antibioticum]NML69747.1 hypothetical protein [Chryseobacterium antibioticum]
MKQVLFIALVFYTSCLFAQDECTLRLEPNTSSLQEKGIVKLSVTNTGNKKVKINKDFSAYRMQLIKITENSPNAGNKINYTADVDCFKDCIKSTVKLKPGQAFTYTIPVKETIQYTKLTNEHTYSFHLFFDLIDLTSEDCATYGLKDQEVIYRKVNHE